ncbi:MAG: hypothetical protein U9R60_10095 [Bacteroidota bacterium]|nr:hypothetical protein [Bacteroidota bacterium]
MNTQAKKPFEAPGKDKGKSQARLFQLLLVLALIIIAGLIIWLFVTKTDLNNLVVEKEVQRVELRAELDSLLIEHELVKIEYGELADSLTVRDSIIQANAEEIKKLLDTQWEYYKVKKKLARLQKISQNYVRQMDSLYRVNEALALENEEIRQDLGQVRREKEAIERDREALTEKVQVASIFQTYNIIADGIRARSGGKEKITDKAKRVDKVKVCFTIGKNDIISSGERSVYVRIAKPDEEVLSKDRTDTFTFEYQGEDIQYSIKKDINYQNTPIDLCTYWYKRYEGQPMMIGTYHVDIFIDEHVVGHTTFQLR